MVVMVGVKGVMGVVKKGGTVLGLTRNIKKTHEDSILLLTTV